MSTTERTPLDREAVAAVDTTDQVTDVLALPEHLRDALWKAESAGMTGWDSAAGLVVAGMGGAGMGGLLARAILGDHAVRPILTTRDYALPPWTTPDTTVLCTSYSGNTEEVLACYEAAGALGARRVVCTTGGALAKLARKEGVPVIPMAGGLRSRAAVGYMTVAALEVAAQCGAGPRLASDLDVAAEHLEELVDAWGPDGPEDGLAKSLARALHGSVPVIAGCGVTAPVAYRWKSQLNANAKLPAFSHELPELDHNEIQAWEGAAGLGPFAAVFLDDCDSHPRMGGRIELTRQLVAPHATSTHVVSSVGTTAAERVFSLVLLGDLVSLYLAVLRGQDPAPLTSVEQLKGELAAR
ncbi:bifunctional phosphoglucose/phosphomannose isomerase [Conexibacter sp. W3-3-2]|uniref:bifunctional phosphoglucose/phosphomannose isomerase n=1 Tax=Conexibacter sp. W3-3-2 TaxID=2675227 RepID=UPI0012B6B7E5|nr:bifunctional phosphoglucose/phosphomannose isomerase [Conexibacter sp. W3-3-2]MTD44128.1 bifunctional phosphoglucose/phosphomannose isomerase [Conexibacter sp. W3-3-2]